MRLRLRVERNGLPATQTLWPVKDSQSTIGQLLHQVDETFPLEVGTWGLEDYSVSVGGYECLHYHTLEAICRDEDVLVIKPLQYTDVRARTLTGRNQISVDGRHLVDGVPFGRPCLKQPIRPEIRIPPRKRQRLVEGVQDEEEADDAGAPLMLTEREYRLNEELEESEEEDEGFGVELSDAVSSETSSEEESEYSEDSDSDASETSESTSEIEEDSSDAVSEDSWNGIPTTPRRKAAETLTNGYATAQEQEASTALKRKRKRDSLNDGTPEGDAALRNGAATPQEQNPPTSSKLKRKRESQDQDTPQEHGHEAKAAKQNSSPPNEGKLETKQRNARRRDSKTLKHLKTMRVLPGDATLETLREWQQGSESTRELAQYGGPLLDEEGYYVSGEQTTVGQEVVEEPGMTAAEAGAAANAPPIDSDAVITDVGRPLTKREKKKRRKEAEVAAILGQETVREPGVTVAEAGAAENAAPTVADATTNVAREQRPLTKAEKRKAKQAKKAELAAQNGVEAEQVANGQETSQQLDMTVVETGALENTIPAVDDAILMDVERPLTKAEKRKARKARKAEIAGQVQEEQDVNSEQATIPYEIVQKPEVTLAGPVAAENAASTPVDAVTATVDGEQQQLSNAEKKRMKKAKKAAAAAEIGAQKGMNMEEQRQELLSAIASGGIDAETSGVVEKKRSRAITSEEDDEPPQEISSKQQVIETTRLPLAASDHEADAQPPVEQTPPMIPPSVARRSKLDLASSKRLLFGSLGLRVPKTQEDREELQKKLSERPKRNAGPNEAVLPMSDGTQPVPSAAKKSDEADAEAAEDADSWRDKINLTAVECCEEGITLSTPPFPFYQRWDPQQRKGKAAKRNHGMYMDGNGKKGKRGRQSAEYVESYDKYNTDGYGDALEYDDVDGEDEEYWEDGALLDEEEGEDGAEDDDFPALPEALDDLPLLKEGDAQKGDFVAFTELACDESTQWEPKTVTRTAKLIEPPGAGDFWTLQLSARDLKPKVFDEEGNRVYSKFEMPDDDNEDEGKREIVWNELGAVRLVLRPGGEVDGEA